MYTINDNFFKWIKGFEGRYLVSNKGKVYAAAQWSWNGSGYWLKPFKEIKGRKHTAGYLIVSLGTNSNNHKNYFVHRLVAEAFIENKNNLEQVNHINEDKTDNHISNLEWVSRKTNMTHNDINYRKWEERNKNFDILLFKNDVFVKRGRSVLQLAKFAHSLDQNVKIYRLQNYKESEGFYIKRTPKRV